jgi:hypothetical protein
MLEVYHEIRGSLRFSRQSEARDRKSETTKASRAAMTGGSIGNLITMEEQESATHVIKDEHPRSKCQEFQKVQVFRKDKGI